MAQGRTLDRSDVGQAIILDEGLDVIQYSNKVEKSR